MVASGGRMIIRSFLKWTGSKHGLISELRKTLPAGGRLVEPFAGSCTVALNTNYAANLLADINPDLINLYKQVIKNPDAFIETCRPRFTPEENTKDRYNETKAAFNAGRFNALEAAAAFLYLNRHGFNGLCRYNRQGAFNVAFGSYKKPYFPEREIRVFATKLADAEFIAADYLQTLKQVRRGDVVYCDPPYIPTSDTANFTEYSGRKFTAADHHALIAKLNELARQGVPVIVSNSLPARPFLSPVHGWEVRQVTARRRGSCTAVGRGRVFELMAVNK
ncbi:Dam family site-specific DNA-(adenine-N6)-methyltransferase [Salmonella enterica]|nr:Dam family site-specific DNA-(adenine-N6)-methyltransferase [Salmonella enterica]EGG4134919.1 Dam family site-specific DNA-(adenine-N6)-methyltransferase [Salmonella enterica]